MMLINKFKIYFDAFVAVRSGIPLTEFLEAKYKIFNKNAPKGDPPFFLSFQPDGDTIRTELEKEYDNDSSDELILRKKYGDKYADKLQKNAEHIQEEISIFEMEIRETIESQREVREEQENLVKNSPELYFLRRSVVENILLFMISAIGEIGMMFFLFVDLFGLDPLKLSKDVVKFPAITFFSVFASLGVFLMLLMVAEQILASNRSIPVFWILCLIFIAGGIGTMRAQQLAAINESSHTGLLLPLVYAALSFGLPLTAANFKNKSQESYSTMWKIKSCYQRLSDRHASNLNVLQKASQNREQGIKQLEDIVNLYSHYYQNTKVEKEKWQHKWENHMRRVDAYLAELKIAYNFWKNCKNKKSTQSKQLKALSLALAILAILLIFSVNCQITTVENGFNVFLVCDRSSSASEFSCSPETIRKVARMWVRKADEAGGGVFEIHIIGKSFGSSTVIFLESYPDKFPGPVSINKKSWRNAFFQRLSEKIKNLPKDMGSAIVEAVYRTSLRIPDRGNTLFVIASDMREVNDVYNFEKKVPSVEEFGQWLGSKGIKPDFTSSTEILIFGVHPYTPNRTSMMTTENYGKLMKLWRTIFEKWGVKIKISEVYDFRDY